MRDIKAKASSSIVLGDALFVLGKGKYGNKAKASFVFPARKVPF